MNTTDKTTAGHATRTLAVLSLAAGLTIVTMTGALAAEPIVEPEPAPDFLAPFRLFMCLIWSTTFVLLSYFIIRFVISARVKNDLGASAPLWPLVIVLILSGVGATTMILAGF